VVDGLHALGGFERSKTTILENPDAEEFVAALELVSQKMAQQSHGTGMLVVYYSGHAGALRCKRFAFASLVALMWL